MKSENMRKRVLTYSVLIGMTLLLMTAINQKRSIILMTNHCLNLNQPPRKEAVSCLNLLIPVQFTLLAMLIKSTLWLKLPGM